MDLKPDVSVIITMYNSESFVENAIQSVLQQEPHGLNIEIIVVDDGSTDRSCQVVKKIKIKGTSNNPITNSIHPFRGGGERTRPEVIRGPHENIRLIQLHANHGQAFVRNVGCGEAKGEWIQFLDSDDRIAPDLYHKFEKSLRPGINCYLFSFIRESKTYRLRQTILAIKDKRAFGHFGGSACNKIVQKNILLPFKPFRFSDICFTVDMMNAATLSIALIPDAYYMYNKKNQNSITTNFDKVEFQRMVNYLCGQIHKSDKWVRMYILEMGVAFLFDRNIPLSVSLRTALRSLLKLCRYLPAVIVNQNRHFIQSDRI